jgi:hypothetical protein
VFFKRRLFLRDGAMENRPSSRNGPAGLQRVRFQHPFLGHSLPMDPTLTSLCPLKVSVASLTKVSVPGIRGYF